MKNADAKVHYFFHICIIYYSFLTNYFSEGSIMHLAAFIFRTENATELLTYRYQRLARPIGYRAGGFIEHDADPDNGFA